LKTLIFQVSDSVTTLQAQGGSAGLTSLQARVTKNEQDIVKLNAQLQIDGTSDTSALEKRVQGIFILSLTALLVGIAALAVATLGL